MSGRTKRIYTFAFGFSLGLFSLLAYGIWILIGPRSEILNFARLLVLLSLLGIFYSILVGFFRLIKSRVLDRNILELFGLSFVSLLLIAGIAMNISVSSVKVVNETGADLSNLRIQSDQIDPVEKKTLSPDESLTVHMAPSNETGVTIEAVKANGETIRESVFILEILGSDQIVRLK